MQKNLVLNCLPNFCFFYKMISLPRFVSLCPISIKDSVNHVFIFFSSYPLKNSAQFNICFIGSCTFYDSIRMWLLLLLTVVASMFLVFIIAYVLTLNLPNEIHTLIFLICKRWWSDKVVHTYNPSTLKGRQGGS